MKALIFAILITTSLFAQSGNLQENKNLADSSENVSYSLGAVLGGPVIVMPKFIASNIYNNIDLQLMAMYGFNNKYRAEFDINYTAFRSGNMLHSFGIGCGLDKNLKSWSHTFLVSKFMSGEEERVTSKYVKLNYTLNWNWFLFQTGVAIGSDNCRDGVLVLQLGCMHRF